MTDFQVWKRVMRYLQPYRRWVILAAFGVLVGNALAIAIPRILGAVIDIGIERGEANFMLLAGLLIIGLGVVRGVMGFFARYYGERLSHYIAYDVRNEVYDKVLNLPYTYHDNANVGTIVTRAISDVDEMQRYYAFGLMDGLNTAVLVIGISIVMFASSPLLTVVTLLPMLPLAFMSRNFADAVAPRWKLVMERMQTLSNHLQENALGAEVVRAFAREPYEIERFGTENEQLYHEQLDFIRQWANFLPSSAFIVASSTAVVLMVGGIMEQRGIGGVTVGLVVSFNAYVLLMAQPMRFLGFVILRTTQSIASSRRVFEILDAEETLVNREHAQVVEEMRGRVHFEDVTFAYEGTKQPALRHIELIAEPGQVTAVLGTTGSGKSTLVNLIPRFYDVQSGHVCVDGVDVRELDLHSLRKHIGIVSQNSILFAATVHENIAYGKPDATRADVIEAAKAASAHDFIMSFPEGYDTLVGERGITVSGGQRQRLAIARALLVRPAILILDDATSSVDTQTEFKIQQALEGLMRDRTTFVIAQRLSTTIDADQILWLEDGEIVERGTHTELLALNGRYKALYDVQLAEQNRMREDIRMAGD